MRSRISYSLLLSVKTASRLFYGLDVRWVGEVPDDPWADIRLIAMLNHTSLFEPLFAAGAPNSLLKRIAEQGVVPVADKTTDRRLVGRFFGLVARDVIPITRSRDHTWERLLEAANRDEALVAMLPEGRMKRATGMDDAGNPMTIRGGIADVLRVLDGGRMLLVYSRGLHHIHVPGERIPRLFKTVSARLETIDIPNYRERLLERTGGEGFKGAVVEDLTRRRDLYCR